VSVWGSDWLNVVAYVSATGTRKFCSDGYPSGYGIPYIKELPEPHVDHDYRDSAVCNTGEC
jgi:hypothetical protein